jgi:hypothetical protein
MSRTLALIVFLAVAVAGLGYVFKGLDGQVRRLKFEADRGELQAKFASKVPHIAVVDADHAAYDLVSGAKAYAKDLADLYKRYPEFKDADSVLKRREAEYKDKKIDEQKMRGIRERVDLTKKVWGKLSSGEYKPVAISADKSVRLDLYDVAKITEAGEDKLLVSVLFINGVPDKAMGFGPINMEMALADDEATAKARKEGRLKDKGAQRKATMSGGGDPGLYIPEPYKFVEDFPPGIQIGYYQFPLMPAEATDLDLTFGIDIKNPGGGAIANTLKFKLPLKDEWKLPKGANFGGDEATDGAGED